MTGQLTSKKVIRVNTAGFGYDAFDVSKNNNKYAFNTKSPSQVYLTDTSNNVTYSATSFIQNGRDLSFTRGNLYLWNDSVAIITGIVDNGTNTDQFVLKQEIGRPIINRRYVEIGSANNKNDFDAWLKPLDVKQKTIIIGGMSGRLYYSFYDTIRNKAVAIKLDSNLNEVWRYTLDSGFYYTTLGILATDDGGCLLYGTKQVSPTQRRLLGWVLKLRPDGTITDLNTPIVETDDIAVYPNPVLDELTIDILNNANSEIQLFDLTGRQVWQAKLGSASQMFHLPPLPSGAYLYKIVRQEQTLKTGKMVKR